MRGDGRSSPTLRELGLYFLRLGATGFGGPLALVGYMERDLVERRRWVTQKDYLEGLALSQLAPGPLASQLAVYIGFIHNGILGATVTGVAFALPGLLIVLAIAAAYVRYGGLDWVQGALYGVGAAVIAIIARSAFKLARLTLGRRPLSWGIFLILASTTFLWREEFLSLFLLSGILGAASRALPPRGGAWGWGSLRAAAPLLALPAMQGTSTSTLGTIFLFFAKSGAVVFGSGLAIVPFLYGGVVEKFGWLNERQFMDAVAVGMITPGPVVLSVAFIGYLVRGLPGALAASLGVFLPVFLFVIVLAGWFRRQGASPGVQGFVEGVTSAAVGALTGAALLLARTSIRDLPTTALALLVLAGLRWGRVPEPILVLGAGAIGLLLWPGPP